MLDFEIASQIMIEHFANLTPEQFLENLKEYCPELFEETQVNASSEDIDRTEIYQQAERESKLKIAAKLLTKGMNIREVAELLEVEPEAILNS